MEEFLKKHKTGKGDEYTHTSMSGGSYNIPDEEMITFLKLYSREVQNKEFHLTERHMKKYGPIVIDLDFKFNEKQKPRVINKEVRDRIVLFLTKSLLEIFSKDNNYTCIVLQRPGQYQRKDTKWSDGLHIQFPYIICDFLVQYWLREKFISEFNLDVACIDSIDKIYDKSVIEKNNWCMYLSTKPDIRPYDVVEIYNSKIVWEDLSMIKKIKILSIRTENDVIEPINLKPMKEHIEEKEKIITAKSSGSVKMEITADQEYDEKMIRMLLNMLKESRSDDYNHWLKIGMILHNCSLTDKNKEIDYLRIWKIWSKGSNKYESGVCERQWKYFKGGSLTIGSLIYYAKKDNPDSFLKYKMENHLKEYEALFPNVALRCESIIQKDHVCIIELKEKTCPFINKAHNEPSLYLEINGLGICLKCKKCSYDTLPNDGHYKLPTGISNKVFGIGKKDEIDLVHSNHEELIINHLTSMEKNPKYEIFEDFTLNKLLYEGLNMTSFDFAVILYYLYKDKFNCTRTRNWYIFRDHRWTQNDTEILNVISINLVGYYKKMKIFYNKLLSKNPKKREKERITKEINIIKNVIKQLKSTSTKTNIVSEAGNLFYKYNDTFESLLNQKRHLFGCNNGVYDLDKEEFRDGRPDDYITLSCGYDYDENAKYEKDIMEILVQILPIEAVRTYLLKSLSICLSGFVKKQKVVFLNGGGSNGKSLLMALVKKVLGRYFAKGPVALITQKRTAAEQASPQLNKMKTARLVMFSEPNKTDVLNSGIIRELSGGEDMANRGLHQDPTDYVPQFKTYILCNALPIVDDNSYGVWRRLRNIVFPSQFVDIPDPLDKNQYKLDENIEDKFDIWRSSFLNILISYYKLHKKEGLLDIPEIMESTDKYKKDSDFYREFEEEFIIKSGDENDYIVWDTLKDKFESWYNENYHRPPPNAKTIKDYFSRNVFKCESNQYRVPGNSSVKFRGWKGVRFISN